MHADQSFHPDSGDGQQAADIAAYELHFLEQDQRAHALLGCAAAQAGAHVLVTYLALLVQTYATLKGGASLADALAETVAEHVVSQRLKGREAVLHQPVSPEGYRAIDRTLGHACGHLESLLAAEAA